MIKRIISTERQEWIVITSDRDIASEAWRCGSIPVPSEVFDETIDAESISTEGSQHYKAYQKGNPHRPSKKERAIRRAINKL